MGNSQTEKFNELLCLFRQAETALKVVEELRKEIHIPSLNQLRYVGKHLLEFLGQEEGDQDEENLIKAERHIKRAIYDSYEAGLLEILEYIEGFHNKFGTLPELREQIPQYDDFMTQADDAHDLIDKGRESDISRDDFYEECEPHWKKLWRIRRQLGRVDPALDEILREKADKRYILIAQQKTATKSNRIAILAIIIGAIIGFSGILVGIIISSK